MPAPVCYKNDSVIARMQNALDVIDLEIGGGARSG
jgi:hypothetical protein